MYRCKLCDKTFHNLNDAVLVPFQSKRRDGYALYRIGKGIHDLREFPDENIKAETAPEAEAPVPPSKTPNVNLAVEAPPDPPIVFLTAADPPTQVQSEEVPEPQYEV